MKGRAAGVSAEGLIMGGVDAAILAALDVLGHGLVLSVACEDSVTRRSGWRLRVVL